MARPKKVKDEVIETPVEEVEETKEEAKVEVKAKTKEFEYPEVGGTGRFESVFVNGGWVLYNPAGQRSSEPLDEVKCKDLAQRMNRSAQIKIKPKK